MKAVLLIRPNSEHEHLEARAAQRGMIQAIASIRDKAAAHVLHEDFGRQTSVLRVFRDQGSRVGILEYRWQIAAYREAIGVAGLHDRVVDGSLDALLVRGGGQQRCGALPRVVDASLVSRPEYRELPARTQLAGAQHALKQPACLAVVDLARAAQQVRVLGERLGQEPGIDRYAVAPHRSEERRVGKECRSR